MSQQQHRELQENILQYKQFRIYVIHALEETKSQLLPLLFFYFIDIYRQIATLKGLEGKKKTEQAKLFLSKFKDDFIHSLPIQKEYMQLYSIHENFEKNKDFLHITQSNKIVKMSQFTMDCLSHFIRSKNHIVLKQFIEKPYIKIQIAQENQQINCLIMTEVEQNQLISQQKTVLQTGFTKQDWKIVNSLEELTRKYNKKMNFPTIDQKNMLYRALEEDKENQQNVVISYPVNKLPKIKIQNQINDAESYIHRRILSEDEKLSVLMLEFQDIEKEVTIFEMGKNANILAVGYLSGKISIFILNPKFDDLVQYLDKSYTKQNNEKQEESENIIEEEIEDSNSFDDEDNLFPTQSKEQMKEKYFSFTLIGHEKPVISLSLNYDELYLLSASADMKIRLWCLRRQACLMIYRGHFSPVLSVKWFRTGNYFATGSADFTARLWTVNKTSCLRMFVGHTKTITKVEFSSNFFYLLTTSLDKTLRVWSIQNGQCVKIIFHDNHLITEFDLSYCGKYLLTGGQNGTVILWDFGTEKIIKSFDLQSLNTDENSKNRQPQPVTSLEITHDETFFVAGTQQTLYTFLTKRIDTSQPPELKKVMNDQEIKQEIHRRQKEADEMGKEITEEEIKKFKKLLEEVQTSKYEHSEIFEDIFTSKSKPFTKLHFLHSNVLIVISNITEY